MGEHQPCMCSISAAATFLHGMPGLAHLAKKGQSCEMQIQEVLIFIGQNSPVLFS